MYSLPNFQIDPAAAAEQERLRNQGIEDVARSEQYQQETKVQQQKTQADVAAKTDPRTGYPKSSYQTLEPKKFGIGENAQELGNAIGGGLVDTVNDVISIPKVLDPKYYEKGEDYKPPFSQIERPITKTVWGNVIRTGVNFLSLGFLTGKAAKGASGPVGKLGAVGGLASKGLKLYGAQKTSLAGRLVQGAVQGAVTDVISMQSTKSNLAAELVKIKPEWEDSLGNFATNEDMSPAQRSLYNVVEGLGIGMIADAALEGVTAGVRSIKDLRGGSKAIQSDPELAKALRDRDGEAFKKSAQASYDLLTDKVQKETKAAWMYNEFKAGKKDGSVHPEMKFADYARKNPKTAWNGLTPEEKQMTMEEYAAKKNYAWGSNRDPQMRQQYQEKVGADLAVDEINRNPEAYVKQDLPVGEVPPVRSFRVVDGGDLTQGTNTSSTNNVFHGIMDQNTIRKNWIQSEGAPRGGLTDANISRIAEGAPGMSLKAIGDMLDNVLSDPAYKQIADEAQASSSAIPNDPELAQQFIDDYLTSRGLGNISNLKPEDLQFDSPIYGPQTDKLYGKKVINATGARVIDLLTGQLLTNARDTARAAKSISDHVDILEQDGLMNTVRENILSMMILRKEASALSSSRLSDWNIGNPAKLSDEAINLVADANDAAKGMVNDIFKALKDDTNDDLLNLYVDALSKSNNFRNFNDLHEAMSRNLKGYTEGDQVQRNAILRELNSMMIHSLLSGPRTLVRAAWGTGFSAYMRPVATIVGSLGSYIQGDDRTMRSAFAELSGMWHSHGEAWELAAASWKAQLGGEIPDSPQSLVGKYTETIEDKEWIQQGAFFNAHGTDGEKAMWYHANNIRSLNRNPILSWSSRAMEAADIGWRHVMARGRLRSMAFNEVYDTLLDKGVVTSDQNVKALMSEAEDVFRSKVWADDGQITDQLAKLAGDEVTMTKELIGVAAAFDKAFQKSPFLRPFMLFARTATNSLELTGKHLPVLNGFLKEVSDVKNLDITDPDSAQILKSRYGISTPEEHDAAKALIRGREAIGMSAVSLAAIAYMNGTITGNGPPDKGIRDVWAQAKWQPRSIKIGNKYVSYDALEPLSTFLSTVADIGDASKEMGEKWTEQQLGRVGYVLGMNLTNKSFMAGLTNLVDLIQMKRPEAVLAGLINGQFPMSGARNEMGKLLAPGMRELQSGVWDSIRNRNLWSDVITADGTHLPYRYDVLNGTKIKDYDFMTRMFNAVSPFQINLGTTPTRELLFRSLYDIKTSVNVGPDNEVLTPSMKSKYQYLIGKQNIEAQLDSLFQNPSVVKSILDMEADRAANRRYDPMTTLHNDQINQIFNRAKRQAWSELRFGDEAVAQEVSNAALTKLAGQRRKVGAAEDANAILNLRNK